MPTYTVSAVVRVVDEASGDTVATGRSRRYGEEDDLTYVIAVSPGRYRITAVPDPTIDESSCAAVRVTVLPNDWVQAPVIYCRQPG